MKKKKLVFWTIFMLTLCIAPVKSIFADTTDDAKEVTISTRKAKVIDPSPDPNSVDPAPNSNTDFRLWKIPTEFNFSSFEYIAGPFGQTVAIDPSKETVTGSNQSHKDIAVGDLRSTKNGWHLSARIESGRLNGVNDKNETDVVLGPTVSFNVIKGEWNTATSPHSWVPGSGDIQTASQLISGTDSVILNALDQTGLGYQGARLVDVELNVPAHTFKNGFQYSGKIIWSLINAPQ